MSETIQQTESRIQLYGRPLTDLGSRPNRSAGRAMEDKGYLTEYAPDNPRCNKAGYVFQHRLVAEHWIGRHLTRSECVHHEDRNKHNNEPSNLWLFPSQAAHLRHHKRDCPRYDKGLAAALVPLAASPNATIQDAARELGVSTSTIRALLDVHAIPWESASLAHIPEKSVREALHGRTTLEAAKLLGVNHNTLRNRYPELLAKRASPGSLEGRKREIRSLAKHTRAADIADRLGVCGATVKAAIRRWAAEEPDAWSAVSAFQLSRRGLGRPPRNKA